MDDAATTDALAGRAEHTGQKPGWVCLGVVGGARGLKGEVWVRSFTARPEDIAAYGPLSDAGGGRTLHLTLTGRGRPGVMSARVEGIDDRTAAEALRGLRLYVPRAALPCPAGDEFYYVDLIGLRADLRACGAAADRPWGRVGAVHDWGAGAVLEIVADDGTPAMVPFSRAAVPEVDLAHGRVVVADLPGIRSGNAGTEVAA